MGRMIILAQRSSVCIIEKVTIRGNGWSLIRFKDLCCIKRCIMLVELSVYSHCRIFRFLSDQVDHLHAVLSVREICPSVRWKDNECPRTASAPRRPLTGHPGQL